MDQYGIVWNIEMFDDPLDRENSWKDLKGHSIPRCLGSEVWVQRKMYFLGEILCLDLKFPSVFRIWLPPMNPNPISCTFPSNALF